MTIPSPHHIVPNNDLKEHDLTHHCWCVPSLDDDIWIHTSLDGREFLEELDLQCGEIPSFLAQVSQCFLLDTRPRNLPRNITLSLQWLNKRVAVLQQNSLIKNPKAIALAAFFESFFIFD